MCLLESSGRIYSFLAGYRAYRGISNALSWLETRNIQHLVRIANQCRRIPDLPRLIILLKSWRFLVRWPFVRLKSANKLNSLMGLSRSAARWVQLSYAPRIPHVKPKTRTHCRRSQRESAGD